MTAVKGITANEPGDPGLETYDSVNRELKSVPGGFFAKGTVPIRLDWSGLALGDQVAQGMVLGHWIWQLGRTPIIAPAGCAGKVRDLREPQCDLLDEPPSQVLLMLFEE
jgi:hypothetical protein